MQTLLDRTIQLAFAAGPRNAHCRRAICRRFRHCVPPRDGDTPGHFRCPFDNDDLWECRATVATKISERLIKVAEKYCSARGLPSPFATPAAVDHLDLAKPLDVATLRAAKPDEE
jgi:hypothetical protein